MANMPPWAEYSRDCIRSGPHRPTTTTVVHASPPPAFLLCVPRLDLRVTSLYNIEFMTVQCVDANIIITTIITIL